MLVIQFLTEKRVRNFSSNFFVDDCLFFGKNFYFMLVDGKYHSHDKNSFTKAIMSPQISVFCHPLALLLTCETKRKSTLTLT